jgi:tetratricopeptide (TPR) repeat protein
LQGAAEIVWSEEPLMKVQVAYRWQRCLAIAVFAITILASGFQSAFAAEAAWRAALAEGDRRMKTKELLAAEVCYREAVRDVRRSKTNSADDVVLCMEKLAANLQTQDQFSESVPLYKKSLRLLQKAHGKKSETTVPTLKTLGDIYENDSQYRVAARYYREALSIVSATSGQSSLRFAELQHLLGIATFKGGYPAQAEKLYNSALKITMQQTRLPASDSLEDLLSDYIDLVRKTYPIDRRILASSLQSELLKDRVDSFDRSKNTEEAGWNKKVSLRMFKSDGDAEKNKVDPAQPTEAPPPIVMDRSMPDSVALQQINKQRQDFYERMIAIDEKTLGPQHPSVARDLTGLAYVFLSQKKYEDAKIVVNRALQIYQASYGADPLVVKRTQLLLNLIDRRQPGADDSAPVKDYLATLPAIPAEAQNIEIALRLNYLGLLCYSEGKIDDAATIYAWALAATARSCGEQSMLAGTCLSDYSRVLRSAGRQPESEQYEQAAHSIVSRALAKEAALLMP